MFRLELLSGAQSDFFELYAKYGDSFYERSDHTLGVLKTYPEAGRIFSYPYRKFMIRKSPIAVFYTIQGNRVLIGAFLDMRQDPENILRRLNNET